MTKEDKELLFKDLSARLPYHVRVKVWLKDGTIEEGALDLEHNYADVLLDVFYYNKIKDIKPYLRPLSSMTKEEVMEFVNLQENFLKYCKNQYACVLTIAAQDWLLAHHFDFRGLIEKGLALEAPKGMYHEL